MLLLETLPGWTWVRVSSFVLSGPAVLPAIWNIDHDKQTNKHIAFYYIDYYHYYFIFSPPAQSQQAQDIVVKECDHSDIYSVMKVQQKDTTLQRCRATYSHWNKKPLGSSVTAVILRPNSCISSTATWFHVPAVSIATGTKTWLLASCLYLVSLVLAALSAAAPAMVAVSARCESA